MQTPCRKLSKGKKNWDQLIKVKTKLIKTLRFMYLLSKEGR